MSKTNKKYYAIKEGNGVKNIILENWSECQPLVLGYSAVYKSFKTEEEAKKYLDGMGEKEVKKAKERIAKAIKKDKEKKATTVSIQTRIPKELYEKFLKRCEIIGLNEKKALHSLMQETFEEWTDDV